MGVGPKDMKEELVLNGKTTLPLLCHKLLFGQVPSGNAPVIQNCGMVKCNKTLCHKPELYQTLLDPFSACVDFHVVKQSNWQCASDMIWCFGQVNSNPYL